MELKRTAVVFNEEQFNKHKDLKTEGLNSQDFAAFVKTAYHEKVDKLRVRHNTFQAVAKETKEAVKADEE